MTVVPDGTISGQSGVPGSGEPPLPARCTSCLRRGVPVQGLGVSTKASRTSPVRLEEGGSLRSPCASVYLSNRWVDAPFPQSVRLSPRRPRHGSTA